MALEQLNTLQSKISPFELLAKQIVEGFITGLHKSPYHGFSVEFAEHKLYNKGESTRHIDWKLYAKTDKLFVRKYEEETNLRAQIIIDVSPSMNFKSRQGHAKLEYAKLLAGALTYLFSKQRDAVGITTFSDDVKTFFPAKLNRAHLNQMYQVLENLEVDTSVQSTHISKTLHQIAERVHKRSIVILITDAFDQSDSKNEEMFEALRHLKFNNHEVMLFQLQDKEQEIEFDFENRPHIFEDLETGKKVELNPVVYRETYRELMESWENEIKLNAQQMAMDFVQCNVNESVTKSLIPFLVKRAQMK